MFPRKPCFQQFCLPECSHLSALIHPLRCFPPKRFRPQGYSPRDAQQRHRPLPPARPEHLFRHRPAEAWRSWEPASSNSSEHPWFCLLTAPQAFSQGLSAQGSWRRIQSKTRAYKTLRRLRRPLPARPSWQTEQRYCSQRLPQRLTRPAHPCSVRGAISS